MKTNQDRNGRNQTTDNGTTDNRATDRRSTKKDRGRRLGEKEWMRRAIAKVAAEERWAKSPPGRRVLAMRIAMMMEELTESKRIEIRLEAGAVRVRFIHLLPRPEPGCLSAIMLPELPAGGWN